MTTCDACTLAAATRWHGEYRSGCFGCEMRGYARSTWAFDAAARQSDAVLRSALEVSHPNADVEQALEEIRRWWKYDQQQKEGTA